MGPTAIAFRLLMKVFDYNLFATGTALFGHMMPDFKARGCLGIWGTQESGGPRNLGWADAAHATRQLPSLGDA